MTVDIIVRNQALALVDEAMNVHFKSKEKAIEYAIRKLNDVLVIVKRTQIRQWFNQRANTGDAAPSRKRKNLHSPITSEMQDFISQKLDEDCDVYIGELVLFVYVEFAILLSDDAILAEVHSLGYTNKIIEDVPSMRNCADRLAFRLLLQAQEDGGLFSPEQLVFVDETHSSDKDIRRKRGWSKKGMPPFRRVPVRHGDGKMVSSICTMTINGLLTCRILNGETNNQDTFLQELEDNILPSMNRFPGPRSIICADNALVHAKTNMGILCDRFGLILFFLSTYSFDYSPIELLGFCTSTCS